MLFDFILSTFTDGGNPPPSNTPASSDGKLVVAEPAIAATAVADKLRVKVKMTSIVFVLNDDGTRLATLPLSAAEVSVLLAGPTMRVTVRLGNLALVNDLGPPSHKDVFRQLLSIEGDQAVDLTYETYDVEDKQSYPGYDTLIKLRSGSFRFTMLEEPVHRLLRFLTKFARMKAVLDAARAAAAQQAADLQQRASKMHYDIVVRTPIIVFPRISTSKDILVANLGEIRAENRFEGDEIKISAGLFNIRLSSDMGHGDDRSTLDMIDDVNLSLDIAIANEIDRTKDFARPDTFVRVSSPYIVCVTDDC